MSTKNGNTTPKQFRLKDDTLADLDAIRAHLAESGPPASLADAVRYAARQTVKNLGKTSKKSTKSA